MELKIVFDNNGVLTTSDAERTHEIVANFLGISKKEVSELFAPFVIDLDTGKITQDEFYRRVLAKANFSCPVEKFKEIHLSGYIPKEEVQEFAKELSKKFDIFILTNFGDVFWNRYPEWKLDRIFKRQNVFVSSDIGLAKPDPRVYEYVLNKIQCTAENVIFIDDNKDNIAAAQAVGIQTILFSTFEDLKNKLLQTLE